MNDIMCKNKKEREEEEELEDLDRMEKRRAYYNREITRILDCIKQLKNEGFSMNSPRVQM